MLHFLTVSSPFIRFLVTLIINVTESGFEGETYFGCRPQNAVFPLIKKFLGFFDSRSLFYGYCEAGHYKQVGVIELFWIFNIVLLFRKCKVIRELGVQAGDDRSWQVNHPLC